MKQIADELKNAAAQVLSTFFGAPVSVEQAEAFGNHLYYDADGPLEDEPPGADWSQKWSILLDGQLVGIVQQVAIRKGDQLQVRTRGGVRALYVAR
jgi:hypothetical protein